jgi:hypothetical protein
MYFLITAHLPMLSNGNRQYNGYNSRGLMARHESNGRDAAFASPMASDKQSNLLVSTGKMTFGSPKTKVDVRIRGKQNFEL